MHMGSGCDVQHPSIQGIPKLNCKSMVYYTYLIIHNSNHHQLSFILLTVWSTLLSETSDNIHKTTVVLHALASTSSWLLGLLLWGHLWGLSTHFTSTGERSVYLSCAIITKELKSI